MHIYSIYIYIYIYIYIPAAFTRSLSLVKTAYPIVNIVQAINPEARAT